MCDLSPLAVHQTLFFAPVTVSELVCHDAEQARPAAQHDPEQPAELARWLCSIASRPLLEALLPRIEPPVYTIEHHARVTRDLLQHRDAGRQTVGCGWAVGH